MIVPVLSELAKYSSTRGQLTQRFIHLALISLTLCFDVTTVNQPHPSLQQGVKVHTVAIGYARGSFKLEVRETV